MPYSSEAILKLLKEADKSQSSTGTTPYKYDPVKQVEGYSTRLEGAGVDVEKATDDRNFMEKLFNLNKKQGFLGDIFEVIDRPNNAWAAFLMGENPWDSLLGNAEKEYSYIDVLKNLGMDDTSSAIFGTVGNIFADFTDIVMFVGGIIAAPFTGGASAAVSGGVIAKWLAEVGGAIADADKITDAIQAGKVAFKNADEVSDFLKTMGKTVTSDEALLLFKKIQDAKMAKGITDVEELGQVWKNVFKAPTQKALNNYNFLGKTVLWGKTATSPLAVYNKFQDIGRRAVFSNVNKLFGKLGSIAFDSTKASVKFLSDLKILNYDDVRDLWKGITDNKLMINKIFNNYKGVADAAFNKLDNVSRALMGDKVLGFEKRISKFLDEIGSKGKNMSDSFDEIWDMLNKSDDVLIKEMILKGKEYTRSVVTTLIETNYYKADGFLDVFNQATKEQEYEIGLRTEKGIVTVSEDADTAVEVTANGATTVIKRASHAPNANHHGDIWNKSGFNKDKPVQQIVDNIGGTGLSSELTSQAGQAAFDASKARYGADQNMSVIINKKNSNLATGDVEVWLHNIKEDGSVEHILAARYEVKTTEAFNMGQGTLQETTDETLVGLFQGFKTATSEVHESKNSFELMSDYLKNHKNILYVPKKGGSVYLLTGNDMAKMTEEYFNNQLQYLAFGVGKAKIKAGDGYRVITRNADGTLSVSDVVRNASVKSKRGFTLTVNEADYPGMVGLISEGDYRRYFKNQFDLNTPKGVEEAEAFRKKFQDFLDSRLHGKKMTLGKTSILEMMSKGADNSREFIINTAYKAKLTELLESHPELKAIFNPDTMFKEIKNFGEGAVAYELADETALDNMKAMLKKLDDKKYASLKTKLAELIDRPDFFKGSFLRDMERLNDMPEITSFRQAYIKFMNGVKADVDSLGDLKTEFAKLIPENYVRHTANKDVMGLAEKYLSPDQSKFLGVLRGKAYDLKERGYFMSIYEANLIVDAKLRSGLGEELYGKFTKELNTEQLNLFYTDFNRTTMDFYNTIYAKKQESILLDTVVSSDMFIAEDKDNPYPLIRASNPGSKKMGYTVVPRKQFTDKALLISQYMEPSVAAAYQSRVSDFLAKLGGDPDNVLIDGNLYAMIGKLSAPDETLGPIIKAIDWVNNAFKQTKLLTPGFHFRNLLGNYTNIALSNINGGEMAELTANLGKYFTLGTKGEALVRKAAVVGYDALEEAEKLDYDLFVDFVRNGFLNTSFGLNEIETLLNKSDDMDPTTVSRLFDKITGASAAGNEAVDRMYRLGLFDMAKRNPAIYQRAGFSSAAEYVRFVLFDPKDLSQVEKNVMRRIMPFYTFTKKNLMYQLQNITKNTKKYRNIHRLLDGAYDLVNAKEEDVPDYQVENMWVPIPFTDKNGEFMTFKANLPQSDLNEWTQNPLRRMLSGLTPMLRAPYEVVTNQQIYTGLPISEFKGQKGFKMPYMSRWGEYALAQTGLDAPMSVGYNAVTGNIGETLGIGKTNLESAARSKAYDELKQLKELMSYYKQQGVRIPTIAELENQQEENRFNQVLQALRG